MVVVHGGPVGKGEGGEPVEARVRSVAESNCERLRRLKRADRTCHVTGGRDHQPIAAKLRLEHVLGLADVLEGIAGPNLENMRSRIGSPQECPHCISSAISSPLRSNADRASFRLYGELPSIMCHLYLAWALPLLGLPDRAVTTVGARLAQRRRLAHPHSIAFALNVTAVVHGRRGEFDECRQRAAEAATLADEHTPPQWRAHASILRGFASARLGRHETGISEVRDGVARWTGIGAQLVCRNG